MNHGEYSVFRLDEGALERLYRQALRSRCEVLFGYPSALTHFAQYVAARGGGERLRLKAVSTTAELLYPDQRALLHRVFQCPVIDEYGASECGYLAGECPAGSRHITAENALIEFSPVEDGAGLAELIVTDLTNLAMPLIRYRIGDLGTAGPPCPCGRGLPVLRLGVGRTEDLVTLPDGRKIDGAVFGDAVERLAAAGVPVKQFRAVQHRADDIEILVATDQSSHPALAVLSSEIQRRLGAPVSVRVRAVDRIPVERTGKLRRFISFVGSDRPGAPVRPAEPAASS
jgi:phenylacetate-CoA ligase